ncbi:SOS response-associated peptidase family protein [Aquimarina sp. U1-2]|uniref:SOS response-associated peptidase family protein n=1 Tax=Aquimarina sp. U1-2 TaxID=2823141 RepID=UPI001AEC94B9|nr:SOS response-associated peptidase family protein [Aquimarina sp. U1-2]MBP2831701.1 SOS response-associated peptidase family protein [Aquimarina sp. U1-2]
MPIRKLSNTAKIDLIESELGRKFEHPKLYRPNQLIDSRNEESLAIIMSDTPSKISFGIWGMLPDDFKSDWEDYQKVYSTLHVRYKNLGQNEIANHSTTIQNCLIIVTGFFIHHYKDGELYPYYVHAQQKPFCLAGIATTLDDGFITCAILVKEAYGIVDKIQNMNSLTPVIMDSVCYDDWLDPHITDDALKHLIHCGNDIHLLAHPIAKELFKKDIQYESMLDPVAYKSLLDY